MMMMSFKFWDSNHILGVGKARHFKFGVHTITACVIDYLRRDAFWMTWPL